MVYTLDPNELMGAPFRYGLKCCASLDEMVGQSRLPLDDGSRSPGLKLGQPLDLFRLCVDSLSCIFGGGGVFEELNLACLRTF